MSRNAPVWRINQLLLFLGMLSIVFAVLKAASAVVVPLMIAIAIAILLSPFYSILERHKVPRIAALILLIVVTSFLLIALGSFLGGEMHTFFSHTGTLSQQLQSTSNKALAKLSEMGIPFQEEEIRAILHPGSVIGFFQKMLKQPGSQLSNIFLIIFMAAFIVIDSTYLPLKLKKVLEHSPDTYDNLIRFLDKIETYFILKARISAVTALWALAVLWYFDIPYLYLWAALAFFLNFIPVIGSIIAAVPPVILALLDHGAMTSVWVAAWYFAINLVMGNIVEPRFMGRGLGLSSTTVFLSMVFWGWMFGPAGMILSVPLTMAFQFLMLQYPETKWFGFLMSDYKGEKR